MAETEYNGIGFNLTAKNSSALNSLDQVIAKLKQLGEVVSGGGIASGLREIGSALKDLKGFSQAEAKNIAAMSAALSGLNGIKVSDSIASGISDIARVARSISDDDIRHIRNLGDAMRGFSSLQGVSGAAIRAATGAKKDAGTTEADATTNALVAVSQAADKASKSLADFIQMKQIAFGGGGASGGGGGGGNVPGFPWFFAHPGGGGGNFNTNDYRYVPSTDVKDVFDAEINTRRLTYTPPEKNPEPIIPDENNEKTQKAIDLSKVLSRTLSTELSAAARTAMSGIKSLAGAFGSLVATAGRGTLNYLTGGVVGLAGSIGNLLNQIRRVAVYRLLRTIVKDLGAALSEGIQNLYQWSLAVDQSFSNAMNTISTAGAYIKNSVAAMVAPLLESLAPALDWLASKIVAVMNLLNQLFSLLTGRGYWTKATKQATNFAKAATGGLGGTGGAAKKLKEDLDLIIASFDELHLLAKENDPNSGSGGGGGGGGSAVPDYAGMFENVAFDEDLKALIDKEDWFGLGAYLAEKMNTVTEALDNWIQNTFRPWALKFAYALGEIINGFVATYHWERLGETVAHGMMAIVDALNVFYETTDWLAIGDAFGRAVRSWFETMDWNAVATYFANKMNAAIEMAKGFVLAAMRNGTDFGLGIADAVTTWFDKVKWNDVATSLIHGFNWAVNALVAWVGSSEMWASIERMFDQFARAIDGVDIEGLANSLGNAFVRGLDAMRESGFITSAGAAVGRFLASLPWGDMFFAALQAAWAGIKGAFSGFFSGEHGAEIGLLIAGALTLKIGGALATAFAGEAFKIMISNALKGGLTAGAEAAVAGGLGAKIAGIISGAFANPITIPILIGAAFLGGAKLLDDKVQGAANAATTAQGQTNVQSFEAQYGDTQAFIDTHGMDEYIKKMNEVAAANQKLADNFDDTLNHIQKTTTDGWSLIGSSWATAGTQLLANNTGTFSNLSTTTAQKTTEIVTDLTGKVQSMVNNYSSGLNNMNNTTNTGWTGIGTATSNLVGNMTRGVADQVSGMETNYNSKLGTMSTDTTSKFTTMLSEAVGAAKDMASGVTSNTSTMASNASSNAESLRSSVAGKISSALDTVLSAASSMAGSMNIYLGKPSVQLPDISVSGIAKGAGLLGSVIMPSWNISWRWFAQGGFPDAGIFLANETGNPEMVGQIGNRPAVANNDQIVAAVSRGVAEAVSRVLGTNNQQAITVNVDGRELFDIMVARNNETVAMTGESPLLV